MCRNWGEENLLELRKGEFTGTGERRTYWNWGEEELQELRKGEFT